MPDMKVGIVTQPLANNYGGILQNFALQQYLKKNGYSPMTIDFKDPPIRYSTYLYQCLKTCVAFFIPSRRHPFPRRDVNRRKDRNEAFVSKHICKTALVGKYDSRVIEEYGIEALVVGSDQVWRPAYNCYLEDMYLRFAAQADIPKISYAASFGVDHWEYTPEQTEACKALAAKFDAISVREGSGIDLCDKHLGVKAVEVIDPTLLLDREDYEKVCSDVPKQKKNVLAAYVLDLTKEKLDYLHELASAKQLEVQIFRADLNSTLTIEGWLAMFRDAEFVITDSFHGTVFSIIFNKPFLSFTNPVRGNSRFVNLLGKFGLTDRIVSSYQKLNVPGEIQWDQVNETIAGLRAEAHNYLTNNLKCR